MNWFIERYQYTTIRNAAEITYSIPSRTLSMFCPPNPLVSFNLRINEARYPDISLRTSSETLSNTRLLANAELAEGGPEVRGVLPVYSECSNCARL